MAAAARGRRAGRGPDVSPASRPGPRPSGGAGPRTSSAAPGTAVGTPGSRRSDSAWCPRRRAGRAMSSTASAVAAAASAGVAAHVHRRGARRARSGPRSAKRWRSTPDGAASPPPPGCPRSRAPGPARCAAPGRRPGPRACARRAAPRRGPRRARRAPRGSTCRRRRVRPSTAAGSSVPATAELPNRLRPKRAPSSSAKSTSATERSAPSSAATRSTSRAAITPSAPSSQPPFGHGVDVGAERHGLVAAPAEARPEVARLVLLDAHAVQLREPLAQERPRGAPLVGPADPPRAAGAAGPLVELAQVRDHPPRIGGHQPTRSRRIACIRQWAPPPPSVNAESSGS